MRLLKDGHIKDARNTVRCRAKEKNSYSEEGKWTVFDCTLSKACASAAEAVGSWLLDSTWSCVDQTRQSNRFMQHTWLISGETGSDSSLSIVDSDASEAVKCTLFDWTLPKPCASAAEAMSSWLLDSACSCGRLNKHDDWIDLRSVPD